MASSGPSRSIFTGPRAGSRQPGKRLVGYDEDELPDTIETFQLLLPPEEAETGLAAWFAARGTTGVASFIDATRLRHKDGRWIPVVVGAYRQYTRNTSCCAWSGFAAQCRIPSPRIRPADRRFRPPC